MTFYAPAGLVGIAVPQANPTVEAEVRLLLPPAVGVLTTRLTSAASEPADRLIAYAVSLPDVVESFDTAPVRAIGFACTGSSYLVGVTGEAGIVAAASDRAGVAVITATAAVTDALSVLDARRIAILTPYPLELDEAAATYWRERGVMVVTRHRISLPDRDTRGIYALPGEAATDALRGLDLAGVDAVLISGTGLPSLPAILAGTSTGVPVLSSNLCLAWALASAAGIACPAGPESPLVGGWAARLSTVVGPAAVPGPAARGVPA